MSSVTDLLLGGALTIAGGLTATLLQGRQQARARADEHAERRREARREKAEQVFQEVAALVSAYSNQWIHAARLATYEIGKTTPGADVRKPEGAPGPPSIAAVEGLVSIYFPACRPLVVEFNQDMQEAVRGYTKQVTDHLKKHQSDGKLEPGYVAMVQMMMAQDLSTRASAFSERLRTAMRPEIQKLW